MNLITIIINILSKGGGCTSEDGMTYYGADSTIEYDNDGNQICTANEE